jgi:hypothetical protein
LRDDRLALGDLAPVPDFDGIPVIASCDLDTLAGVPGCKLTSIEAVGDDVLTTFLARRT